MIGRIVVDVAAVLAGAGGASLFWVRRHRRALEAQLERVDVLERRLKRWSELVSPWIRGAR